MANQITAALKRTESNLDGLADAWQRIMRGRVFAGKALRALQQIPGPPTRPIGWTSERQRRAYFASQGFGRGIPTVRTGEIAGAWEAEFIPTQDGGLLALTNPYDAAKFIHGPKPWSQDFHIDTGWTQIESVEESFFQDAEDAAVAVWFNEIDPFEGI